MGGKTQLAPEVSVEALPRECGLGPTEGLEAWFSSVFHKLWVQTLTGDTPQDSAAKTRLGKLWAAQLMVESLGGQCGGALGATPSTPHTHGNTRRRSTYVPSLQSEHTVVLLFFWWGRSQCAMCLSTLEGW